MSSLRPKAFSDFVGQRRVCEKLKVYVEAARARGEPLDHVLLCGPPGLGKTTLATILAHEMGVGIRLTSGPVLTRPGDVASILASLEERDVLFLDEIHRLPKPVEEVLYVAMEDFQIDVLVGKGIGARSVRVPIKPFTLVGATTRLALVSPPLRSRFGIVEHLSFYPLEEMMEITRRVARSLGMELEESAVEEIARRSRGVPRIAGKMVRRVRDYAQVEGWTRVDASAVRASMRMMGLDDLGLDEMDRRLLLAIIERFGGGPVGLKALASYLQEDPNAIEEVYEPYLVELGLIDRTPRGRRATERAYAHLGLSPSSPQTAF